MARPVVEAGFVASVVDSKAHAPVRLETQTPSAVVLASAMEQYAAEMAFVAEVPSAEELLAKVAASDSAMVKDPEALAGKMAAEKLVAPLASEALDEASPG